MPFTYVGDVPRNLESGRPIYFGDVIDSLTPEDEAILSQWLVTESAPEAPTPTTDEVK